MNCLLSQLELNIFSQIFFGLMSTKGGRTDLNGGMILAAGSGVVVFKPTSMGTPREQTVNVGYQKLSVVTMNTNTLN